jgi:arylsulfatase A-like enzyme
MIAKKQPSGCEDWEAALDERPKDRPFFMWLAALDPHRAYEQGALNPPHKDSEVIVPAHLPDTSDVRKDLRMHYDEIGRLDQYVGKVLGKLEQQGVADDTIVLFISDNGRPFPRDKTTLYDGGIRTPWLIRWPATIAAGAVTESLVSSVDIAPTFLQLAGSTSDSFESEGVSFAETLTDPTKANRQFAFAEDHWHDYEDQARAVVNQQYKLIRNDYEDLAATPSADARRAARVNMAEHVAAGERK